MLYSLPVTFREGLEAALILAIVLEYLRRIGEGRRRVHVWAGASLAFVGSVAAAAALQLLALELPHRAQEALEGGAMLLAVAVLTWMVFWMRRQAASIGRDLRSRVDAALGSGSALALGLLAFSAVGREGLETALFLFAGSGTWSSPTLYWVGAGLGLALAVAVGCLVYAGSRLVPVRAFFSVTAVVLVVLAAGLLANGLKEMHEAGLLTALGPRLWDTYSLLPDNYGPGELLGSVLGYDASPFLGQVAAYLLYLSAAALLLLGASRPAGAGAAVGLHAQARQR
ncbi:MAG TPA: FTR1 family protein [Dehalococcoidia bacterium]|nr:FTR1 family protein [Dehalococcoidia bacterium]